MPPCDDLPAAARVCSTQAAGRVLLARSVGIALLALPGCGHATATPPPAPGCPPATSSIAGACLSRDQAASYCGKGARPEAGGCAPVVCADDEPADLDTGACVPLLSLRQLAAGPGVRPKMDAGVGCAGGGSGLVVERQNLACLPRASLCGRGGRWASGACHPDPVCPRGAVPDETGQCVAVTHRRGADDVLDVGAWIRLVVGPDGGPGSGAVCAPLRLRPWRSGVAAHGTASVDVEVDLVFPDNEVKAARVDVRARRAQTPHEAESALSVGAGQYLAPLWEALRSIGGVASAASATVVVRCAVEGGGGLLGASTSEKPEKAPELAPSDEKP